MCYELLHSASVLDGIFGTTDAKENWRKVGNVCIEKRLEVGFVGDCYKTAQYSYKLEVVDYVR